ncbi:TolC family protein [Grimontia hollisae]|uniref:TolC family protein n=1 Tax=Grimontia hollisae TaxID=673 RepID=UPI001302FD98|nr:TolC family protein [Grimontia hollisae]
MKAKPMLLLMVVFPLASYATISDFDLNIKDKDRVYHLDNNQLYVDSIEGSYKVDSQKHAIKSEEHLYDAANYYYIPSVTISSQIQQKMDRPGHPSPNTEFSLELSARLKMWSDTVGDQKDAAYYRLLSEKDTYNQRVNEVYSIVHQNLVKIEAARTFLERSKHYKAKMDLLLSRMDVSSKAGILKKSDRVFADVTLKKFDESVLNIQSQVEQYKSLINNLTPNSLYKDGYGLSNAYIKEYIKLTDDLFDFDRVVSRNFKIKSKRNSLMADKYNMEATNENFKVELVTQHNIKENKLSSIKNKDNVATEGYTYDNDGNSYIGVQATFTGINYAGFKNKQSEREKYIQKSIEYDEFLHTTKVELNTLKSQSKLIYERMASVENQINLTTNVIKNQLNEMSVDESSAMDIFRNISSLLDLEINKLTILNELIDLSTKINEFNANIPNEYVIK